MSFISYHNPHYNHQVLFYIFSTCDKEKLKQSEMEAKMIMKTKETWFILKLVKSFFEQYWWTDTCWSLWDLSYYKNLKKGSSDLLDVRVNLKLVFKIFKLISLKFFEVSHRNILVIVASMWFKIFKECFFQLVKKNVTFNSFTLQKPSLYINSNTYIVMQTSTSKHFYDMLADYFDLKWFP